MVCVISLVLKTNYIRTVTNKTIPTKSKTCNFNHFSFPVSLMSLTFKVYFVHNFKETETIKAKEHATTLSYLLNTSRDTHFIGMSEVSLPFPE